MVEDEAVAETVELAGRDPGADMGGDEVERLRRKPAGAPHAIEVLWPVDTGGFLVPPPGVVDLLLVHQCFPSSASGSGAARRIPSVVTAQV